MSDPLIRRVINNYRLERLLGRGGMAKVYLARDEKLQRDVAVKVISVFHAEEETFQARFQQEALATAKLEHPNIVHIYDYGQDGDLIYMVMEYLPGGTLHDVIKEANRKGQHVDTAWALVVIQQIALALDHAHHNDIIHRDIKPSNIMFAKDGRAVLTDLGIAKALQGPKLTKTLTTVGTPEYMSPEQGKGEQVDSRSDLYSLGVVLYELLAGLPPYRADTPWGIVFKHVSAPLPPIQNINPQVSPALRSVVERALAKRPADRFQTGREMVEAISRAQQTPYSPLYAPPPVPDVQPAVAESEAATQVMPSEMETAIGLPAGTTPAPQRSPKSRRGLGRLWPAVAGLVVVALVAVGLGQIIPSHSSQNSEVPLATSGASIMGLTSAAGEFAPTVSPGAVVRASAPTISGVSDAVTHTAAMQISSRQASTVAPTVTAKPTEMSTPTMTSTATATSTSTATATATATPTATPSPAPTATARPTSTPLPPLTAPAILEPIGGSDAFGKATLKWTPVAGADHYLIQTRSDLESQTEWGSWSAESSSNEYVLYFEGMPNYFRQPGTIYQWRVIAIDSQGHQSVPSAAGSFKLQRAKPKIDF